MEDANWNKGYYYDKEYPQRGMILARYYIKLIPKFKIFNHFFHREIATLTYRSGPEWEKRFGRDKIKDVQPSLCPNFEIEQYIEYQGLSFSKKYDPNSLLYISKVRKNHLKAQC